MRKAFSLVTAIIFLVLVATLAMFSLNLSATTAKQTTDVFLREQAELLAQSATEMAILQLLQTNFTTMPAADCPINTTFFRSTFPTNEAANSLFRVNVRLERLFGTIGNCVGTAIQSPNSVGIVILDTTVESINDARNIPPVRFHRRTIQKL